MSELSLRHLPDLSVIPDDFSDSSFQIPASAGNANEILLADDTIRLPSNVPLTLAELTPRSRPIRTAPVRSSLRPRPAITTPHRNAFAPDLSAALSEDLSPFCTRDASFQIPTVTTKAGDLLTDDVPDFVGSRDDSLDNFAPPKESNLRQLGPGSSKRFKSPFIITDIPSDAVDILPLSKISDRQHGEALSNETQPRELATSIPSVIAGSAEAASDTTETSTVAAPVPAKGKDKEPVTSAGRRKEASGDKKAKRKQTVLGGITKTMKPKIPSSFTRNLSASAKGSRSGGQRDRAQDVVHRARGAGSSGPSLATDRLADTLMAFGKQMMMNSARTAQFELSEIPAVTQAASAGPDPVISAQSSEVPTRIPAESLSGAHDKSLTLSQLSPVVPPAPRSTSVSEPLGGVLPDVTTPPTPMRQSTKRSTPPDDGLSSERHKRSKIAAEPAASKSGSNQRRALQPSRAKNTTASSSASGPSRARRGASTVDPHEKQNGVSKPGASTSRSVSRRAAGEEAEKTTKPKGQSADAVLGSASLKRTGRSGDPHRSQRENVPETENVQWQLPDGHMYRSRRVPAIEKPAANLPPARTTKPIEFQFHTETRIEARKAELGKSGSLALGRSKAHAPFIIPDFKALHVAQELQAAARKEQIVPLIPLDIGLQTEVRAHEREKFEEARREREREIERQMEERRRQQELEEEREIKELRKRAVPKAHEVPECAITGHLTASTRSSITRKMGHFFCCCQ
ncbi:hypothetical protein A0H81_01354 [Grifola frondosa]|uniref:TPX2 C-terminal domain-containing protein n=1 Tax=Grifola frondosa TaxID=5627 RepID=A0A1C7MPT5_GRIFR|nr:hypothetical protein A0H81_01354 [Grifola frondosa]